MVGATDFFFTLVIVVIAMIVAGFAVTKVIGAILEWQYNRECKKLRCWLLGIFDSQLDRLRFKMEQEGRDPKQYGLEFSHLRWLLSAFPYFFHDLARFKDRGAPILLSFPRDADRPVLFLGVSDASQEISLSEGSVLNPNRPRIALPVLDAEALRD